MAAVNTHSAILQYQGPEDGGGGGGGPRKGSESRRDGTERDDGLVTLGQFYRFSVEVFL